MVGVALLLVVAVAAVIVVGGRCRRGWISCCFLSCAFVCMVTRENVVWSTPAAHNKRCSELRTQYILETTEREKTASTMVDDRQRLQMMEMRNQRSTNPSQYRKVCVVRWRWSHF